jgi:hypothetical protein
MELFPSLARIAVALALGGPVAAVLKSVAQNSADTFLSAAEAPLISIQRDPGSSNLSVAFEGELESSETPDGPWTLVEGVTSPTRVDGRDGPKFFRARQSGSVFSGTSPLQWTLTGPFQKHFELAYAGLPDGIFPPVREKPYFDGALRMGELEIPVTLRVRGNSSLQECPFPKLKLKVSRENREGTPFADAREIKIGTHCAEGGRGTIGRLRSEIATFREATVYELMRLMQFVGPRVRRARIEYQDTTPEAMGDTGWRLTREALVFDDVEVVAERLGGRALSDEEVADLDTAHFDPQLVADLLLFEALVGNWDFEIARNGRGLWNIEVIQLQDGTYIPVAGDFDLSSWVTGEPLVSAPHDYHPELGDVERQVRFDVEEALSRVGADRFASAASRFSARRSEMQAWVENAAMDDAGRTNALRRLAAFFDALDAARQTQ